MNDVFIEYQNLLNGISHLEWLQDKVAHFVCRNLVFFKMACIYMLLTWHKDNNFPNLLLALDFQLEEDIYQKHLQHTSTKYIVINF
jgi:hypothetical protein